MQITNGKYGGVIRAGLSKDANIGPLSTSEEYASVQKTFLKILNLN